MAVDQRVELFALFAQRALVGRQALISLELRGAENGDHGLAAAFFQAGEDAADVFSFNRRITGYAGSDRDAFYLYRIICHTHDRAGKTGMEK